MPVPPLDPLVSAASDALLPALPGCRALVLGGSHSRGEAVWVQVADRARCLSDLDLHAVMPDRAARAGAAAAVAAGRAGLESRLAALGLAAPVDLGLHTIEEWERTPARPATLELRRSGQMLHGEAGWLERLPAWSPGDVSPEEVRLLLENRVFELIAARGDGPTDPLAEARAAHAQYKCALDLAGVDRLECHAWEASAAERVRAARAARPAGTPAEEPAWDAALAWLRGQAPDRDTRLADWWRIAAGWLERWRRAVAPGTDPADFESLAFAAARRARPRRRLALALLPEMGPGLAPPLTSRLRHALVGTPQHRLNASAGATLAALVLAHRGTIAREEALARLECVLAGLGAVPASRDERAIARALRETWDRWVMGQTRGAGPA